MVRIGIIGGSGFERSDIVSNLRTLAVDTPWGEPSALPCAGEIANIPVVMLPRHGREHCLTPTGVNYRANIDVLRRAGCTHVLATTAVGSLREEIKRGDLVILDQFIDFTRLRKNTFFDSFEPNSPVHTGMADPFDSDLREILIRCCAEMKVPFHAQGTVVTIEGPRFSTRAESRMFQSWGGDVINMSIATEAALAAEAGLPYAAVGMSTDYDCWRTDEEPVSWDAILAIFNSNIKNMNELLIKAVQKIGAEG